MAELMEDSFQQVQLVATELGNHNLVRKVQEDQVQLEEDAHDADMLIDLYTMDTDQDEVESWGTDATQGTPSQLHSTAWVSPSSPHESSSPSCHRGRPVPSKHTHAVGTKKGE